MTTEEIKNHIQLLAEQQYPNAAGSSRLMVLGFIKGYEAAKKELFTEEDLIQAIKMARETEYPIAKGYNEIIEIIKENNGNKQRKVSRAGL